MPHPVGGAAPSVEFEFHSKATPVLFQALSYFLCSEADTVIILLARDSLALYM